MVAALSIWCHPSAAKRWCMAKGQGGHGALNVDEKKLIA